MNDPYHDLRIKARELESLFKHGCTDGYCKMRPKSGGMHTNNGCRCIETLADLALDVAAEADKFGRGRGKPMMMGTILV